MRFAFALFGLALVLSLAALRERRPGSSLLVPVWRLTRDFTPRGARMNVVALGLTVAGALLMLLGGPQ